MLPVNSKSPMFGAKTEPLRYNVPLRVLANSSPFDSGWANHRSAYQRPDYLGVSEGNRSPPTQSPVYNLEQPARRLQGITKNDSEQSHFNFQSGQRSVELSRIDNAATLAAAANASPPESFDRVNNYTETTPDGLVDIENYQNPLGVCGLWSTALILAKDWTRPPTDCSTLTPASTPEISLM